MTLPIHDRVDARIHSTTVLGLVRGGEGALGGDGQVTFGQTILKSSANKLRRMRDGQVLAGFAGSAADGLRLFERFEEVLDGHSGQLRRTCVEFAKEWRSDRVLRRLEAQLAVLDRDSGFLVSGAGDVIEPDDGIIAIGSGAPYALAASRALCLHTELSAVEIVEQSLRIAADICIYTGGKLRLLSIPETAASEREKS